MPTRDDLHIPESPEAKTNWPAIVALVGLIAAGAGAVGYWTILREPDAVPQERQAPPKPMETEQQAESKAEPSRPEFDVVRLDPAGNMVIAGRAAPDAVVRILADGKQVGSATADERGEWVFLPKKPLAPGNYQLTLETKLEDGTFAKSPSSIEAFVPKPGRDIAGREGPGGALIVETPSGGGPTAVHQTPSSSGDAFKVAIAAVDHDELGRMIVSGTAPANGLIHLYMDDGFMGRAKADAKGKWSLRPAWAAPPGNHALRADLVDANGRVLERMEFPFARQAASATAKATVTIEPGNSLWRIARKIYGSGYRFTVIYEANKKLIRDPNLIYPGQVFALPAPPR